MSSEYSVGEFCEDAMRTTKDILDRGHVPIVAGGTELYLQLYVYKIIAHTRKHLVKLRTHSN